MIMPLVMAGRTCAQAGALLAPVAEAITERSRGSWHLHADETTWRVRAAGRRWAGEMAEKDVGLPRPGHRVLRRVVEH